VSSRNEARVRALDQAKADLDKAQARVEAAENAHKAAERVAEKERSARLRAEEEIDNLMLLERIITIDRRRVWPSAQKRGP
jgi:hypothetical protein